MGGSGRPFFISFIQRARDLTKVIALAYTLSQRKVTTVTPASNLTIYDL